MKINILITGATGNVGSEVIKSLLLQKKNKANDEINIIAAVRNINKAKRMLGEDVDYSQFDFENPSTFSSLKGIDKLFLVRPPEISNAKKYIKPVIDWAKSSGIKHIVFLSLIGVEKNYFVPHRKIETYIKQSGIPYTFLRAGFFMQNLETSHLNEIKINDEIFIPAGTGRTSFIDVRDIAEIAAKALTQSGHTNKAYDLTGKEAISYYDAAQLFSEILKREVKYKNPTVLEFIKRKKEENIPLPFILVMTALYTTARLGLAGRISHQAEILLGRPQISLEEYIRDHKSLWLRS
ncbi:MAG: SDR family oxidoreductase [Bacillota bacterium]